MTWIPLAFECLPPEISLLGPPVATRRTISSSWRSDIFPATPGRRFFLIDLTVWHASR
jgi:hypothetical protein